MRLKEIKLLGIKVTMNSKKEILEYVRKYLAKSQKSKVKSQKSDKKPLIIVTPNPEQVVLAKRDKQFANILNQADVAIPDGVGLALASRFLKSQISNHNDQKKLQRIAGIEFMEDLVEMAQKEGYRIGLIGGRSGVAVKALECLKTKYPGLQGWAEEPPEIKLDQLDKLDQFILEITQKIRSTDTYVVFVGLGAPKQEYLMEAISNQLSAISYKKYKSMAVSSKLSAVSCVLMSVGGSFDILAGRVARAPFIIRHIGLEWLWRLTKEPWRWRRQRALITFLWMMLRESLSKRAS